MHTQISPADTPLRSLSLQLLDLTDALHTLCSALAQDSGVSDRTREHATNLWHVSGRVSGRIDQIARMKDEDL